jgi:hypothetical protein
VPGKRLWAIAEGYIPGASTGSGRAFESHETVCLLNAGPLDAHVEITLYFADREPVGPYGRRSPPAAPCTCASTTSPTRRRCRATPITPA